MTTQPLATVTSHETAPNISAIPASMIASCPRRPRTLANSSGITGSVQGLSRVNIPPKNAMNIDIAFSSLCRRCREWQPRHYSKEM
ncbi:hypothetical protein [Klebsiella quasipneumoniae]|uniref:hypothetical protein n=1 Tax=Klebsiella quasipneumoniae TaxID=1463165 RepID=UPI000AD1AEBC|nr:hypothetical protein [Klebsiella quasipneumoniae]